MSSPAGSTTASNGDDDDPERIAIDENGFLITNYGVQIEDDSNDDTGENLAYHHGQDDGTIDIGHAAAAAAKRRHRKALDIKNNGLSTDGLQIMIDRYEINANFIQSIQSGTARNRLLIVEMRGQTASQIYTRCSKRDAFTETHVGDDIMATFSTIRDYRAACDMHRMDPERFRQVFDLFAAWNEPQYEEFKRNYTLEYVFRRIFQRDARYRGRYSCLLQQCQETTDISTIDRPLLPLPTPKFLIGDGQLELCNSSLRSKLRNMRRRDAHGASEISPESQAYLARLDEAVRSFFRRLDFVEISDGPLPAARSTYSMDAIVDGIYGRQRKSLTGDDSSGNNESGSTSSSVSVSRKRPSSALFSARTLMSGKRPANSTNTTTETRATATATPINTLARAVLRKAVRSSVRVRVIAPKTSGATNASDEWSQNSFGLIVGYPPLNDASSSASFGPASLPVEFKYEHSLDDQRQQQRQSRSMSKSHHHHQASSSASSSVSIMQFDEADAAAIGGNDPNSAAAADLRSCSSTLSYDEDHLPVTCVPLLGVGADEPIDEDDLRSILNDLAGMHAVVTCEDLGRIIDHGSVQHPQWGTVLIRRGRVVRLGTAQIGFQAPDPNSEFHFPMEHLADYIPPDKIRFDDERNLYLNGILTDFYFLQP